jgi:hypothetical protein
MRDGESMVWRNLDDVGILLRGRRRKVFNIVSCGFSYLIMVNRLTIETAHVFRVDC